MHPRNGNLPGGVFPFEHLDKQKEAVSLAGYLVLRAQAPGADIDFPFLAIGYYRDCPDVGQPLSFCASLGVAHIMAKLSSLAANLASHSFTFD